MKLDKTICQMFLKNNFKATAKDNIAELFVRTSDKPFSNLLTTDK